MKNYQDEARAFLNECAAEMSISFSGYARPNWDNKEHALYTCIIKTKRGQMTVEFFDSLANTEKLKMTPTDYPEEVMQVHATTATYPEKIKAIKEVQRLKITAKPTEYDILACLTKYDVGTMDEFLSDFGYEIKSASDITNFIDTYNAVIKEYRNIRRCFTPEQIEKMQEIQ